MNPVSIGTDNGLLPITLNFKEIAIIIQNFSFTKMHLKTATILSRGRWAIICAQRPRSSVVLHNTDICQLGNATDDPEETSYIPCVTLRSKIYLIWRKQLSARENFLYENNNVYITHNIRVNYFKSCNEEPYLVARVIIVLFSGVHVYVFLLSLSCRYLLVRMKSLWS